MNIIRNKILNQLLETYDEFGTRNRKRVTELQTNGSSGGGKDPLQEMHGRIYKLSGFNKANAKLLKD